MSGTAHLPAIATYVSLRSSETDSIARFEKSDAQTRSDIAYFTKQAPKLKTVDAFLKDYRSVGIVLNAFGMSANISQTALIRKLITQDPTNSTSVAQKLANPTYLRFAKAMTQFKPPPFSVAGNVASVIKAIGTNNFEAATDAQAPGVGDALYFKRTIQSLTSLNQLMSDPKLMAVATVATNMPDQFGQLDYTQQVKLLSAKIDMKKFQMPAFVDRFVTKFLAINTANTAKVTDTTGVLSILTGSGSASNVLSASQPTATSNTQTANLLSLFA